MLYYPLTTLMLADIREVLIICLPRDYPAFYRLLGDGSQWGMSFQYAEQAVPNGIAEAFIIGESFIGNDSVCLILGDNLFFGEGLAEVLLNAKKNNRGATVFGYTVHDPERYGVLELDASGNITDIQEKPEHPPSNIAVTGLYFYDNHVANIARSLTPSARGELEITDITRHYLKAGNLKVTSLGRGFAWLDTGTPQALLEASEYVAIMERRQGLCIASPEEIAWRQQWINSEQLTKLSHNFKNSAYGTYLSRLVNKK